MIRKVAIITRPENKSPKVLAYSFQSSCKEVGVDADIFWDGLGILGRMFGIFQKTKYSRNLHFKIRLKLIHLLSDYLFFKKMKSYDLIVISDCSPNAYWKGYYNIERLKRKIKKPVALFEVYFLGNSISQTEKLKESNDFGIERYDWNYSISPVTEIRGIPSNKNKWSCIGLNLTSIELIRSTKKEIIAIVDFVQSGFEENRKMQMDLLKRFPEIKIVSLEGNYSISEIRQLYKMASLFFVQFPESFGVSIAECLSVGCQIIIKEASWAMSWRLQNDLKQEYLPDCFFVYENNDNLTEYLSKYVENHQRKNLSERVTNTFISNYPSFYYGDKTELIKSFSLIEQSFKENRK